MKEEEIGSLIIMCLGVFPLGFILFGTLWGSWTWLFVLEEIIVKNFPKLSQFFFLIPFLLVFFFWDTYNLNVGAFNIVPEISEAVLISLVHFFFLFSPSASFIPKILSSTSLIHSYAPIILLLVPSRMLFTSIIALFIIDWLFFIFFISSRSLLNISCIFSILVSSQFICSSILFSRFWIIFAVNILNSFSGRLPISSSKASILLRSAFFIVHSYIHTWPLEKQ